MFVILVRVAWKLHLKGDFKELFLSCELRKILGILPFRAKILEEQSAWVDD